jgi:hypothetical protein
LIFGLCLLTGGGLVDLAVGWWYFVQSELPRVVINPGRLLASAAALVLAVTAVHLLVRRLRRHGEWRLRWTLQLTAVAFVLLVAGIAVSVSCREINQLWHANKPIATRYEEQRARQFNTSQLQQIGLASNAFVGADHSYPPGYVTDRWGQPLHGWQVQLLPYLEQDNAYRCIHFDLSWDHPENRMAYRSSLATNAFTSRYYGTEYDAKGYGISHFAGNRHALPPNRGLRIRDFRNSVSDTILAGEVTTGFRPWGYPLSLRDPARGIRHSADAFAGPWADGVTYFTMADGSVRSFTPDVAPEVLESLARPARGR